MYNPATVTDVGVSVDRQRLSKYISGKNALVAQGGGQRGIFTSGVLDAFLASNFDPFDEYFGTSAGALNISPFLCRQPELGRLFITELTTDPNFFNLFGYIRRKQYLDLSWALRKIEDNPYCMDIDKGRKILSSRKAFASVTDSETLSDTYLPMFGDDWRDVLLASCAIPTLCADSVNLGNKNYIDGGVSAAIPVQQAWRRDNRFIVVIRTEGIDQTTQHLKIGENYTQASPGRDGTSGMLRWNTQMQEMWSQRFGDWSDFFRQKFGIPIDIKKTHGEESLNGGRWLFGADTLYRISDWLGTRFDSSLADIFMVHFQSYALTLEFLNAPPDDAFILQIAPSSSLKSGSLLSRKSDLEHDYQLGLQAGYNFIEEIKKVDQRCPTSSLFKR